MITAIVFSKDRPLQLHAYLESLLRFSGISPQDIYVIYCVNPKISYEKVMGNFSEVNWIEETDFDAQLRVCIANAKTYIMFGCDDVIFKGGFSVEQACSCLETNERVFGVTMRLGKNITPRPEITHEENMCVWNWKETKEMHYNYPWELDCTIYRKADVQGLVEQYNEKIKNPNYFEKAFSRTELISRDCLACFDGFSKSIVLTINRVQDDFLNTVDETLPTDVYSLAEIYNAQNNTLDIDSIAKKVNRGIHVGSEFFILKAYDKKYGIKMARRVKDKIADWVYRVVKK